MNTPQGPLTTPEPTPGQAAWEAFAAKRRADLGDEFYTPAAWGDDYEDARKWEAAWELAAKAGHQVTAAQDPQPSPSRVSMAFEALNALLAEVCDDIEHVVNGNAEYIDRDMLDAYRARAEALPGLDAKPAPDNAPDARNA